MVKVVQTTFALEGSEGEQRGRMLKREGRTLEREEGKT
jgi:hypothetical protein